MPDKTAVARTPKEQSPEKSGSIDIASILNFRTSGPKPVKQPTQDGIIASVGDNPSLVVSSRSQMPATQWERYHMNSSPQSGQGGILAGGVMVAFRVEIG